MTVVRSLGQHLWSIGSGRVGTSSDLRGVWIQRVAFVSAAIGRRTGWDDSSFASISDTSTEHIIPQGNRWWDKIALLCCRYEGG